VVIWAGSNGREGGTTVSDDVLRLVPTQPDWVPDDVALRRAVRVLRDLAPRADSVRSEVHDAVAFSGGTPVSIVCPSCGDEVDATWWSQRMERAAGQDFAKLAVVLPCCGTRTSLADLRYDPPAWFTRVELRVRAPGREGLSDRELARVGEALGHPVRVVGGAG
jgi:hypothetical protein